MVDALQQREDKDQGMSFAELGLTAFAIMAAAAVAAAWAETFGPAMFEPPWPIPAETVDALVAALLPRLYGLGVIALGIGIATYLIAAPAGVARHDRQDQVPLGKTGGEAGASRLDASMTGRMPAEGESEQAVAMLQHLLRERIDALHTAQVAARSQGLQEPDPATFEIEEATAALRQLGAAPASTE